VKADFLFIGPSKSGSTWIYEYFMFHPQVFVPKVKDIYYFDSNYFRGDHWYNSYFSTKHEFRCFGEVCHDYLYHSFAHERIFNYNNEMKLICCLRNPIHRAWSSYMFHVRNGMKDASFFEAVEKYPEILSEGLYAENLRSIYRYFKRENVLVLDFRDVAYNPEKLAKDVCSFLNLDYLYDPRFGKKINQGSTPRSAFLARTLKSIAIELRRLGFLNLVGFFKRNSFVKKILYKEISSPIPPDVYKFLADYYLEDARSLSVLFGDRFSYFLDVDSAGIAV
jgi:hypothetical protein